MNINIEIYSHELNSALSRLHEWSSQYDWGATSGNPSFDVTIQFIPDPGRLAERVQIDRLLPWEEALELQKERNAESTSLLEKLRKHNIIKEDNSLSDIEAESLELMNFLRGGNHNG